MTAPADAAASISNRGLQVLRLGGTSGIPWKDAAALDWFGSFDVIYCEPLPDSDHEQVAFATALRETISGFRRWKGRIVWVANEHFSEVVAAAIGCGDLLKLPALPDGRILTVFGDMTPVAKPVLALRNLPHGWSPFATWRDSKSVSEMVVGTMSANERWIVAPPGAAPADFVMPYEAAQRFLPLALIAFLILATLFLGRREYQRTTADYDRDVGRIGTANVTQTISSLKGNEDSAANRMLNRLLWRRSEMLTSIADEVRFAKNPYQLWTSSESDYRGPAHFELALVSGDLDTAYRIAAAAAEQPNEFDWRGLLTDTLWQRALESLLELDFRHAEVYASMFVQLANLHARAATDRSELEPQRNRTLAMILWRELRSPRIYSLCSDPEKARYFARLVGGDWGETLEISEPSLARIRAENVKTQCAGKVAEPFDYSQLEELESIGKSTSTADLAICKVTPVECEFLRHRETLLASERPQYETAAAAEALAFAASCSYLSDDLVGAVVQGQFPMKTAALDRALVCIDEGSDYANVISASFSEYPCDRLLGRVTEFQSPRTADLVHRCAP